jgi:hypothetical protein
MASAVGVDLDAAFAGLQKLYDYVDERNATNTRALDLPCHRGCSMCCKESVFMTPLEFFFAWDYVQKALSDETRSAIVDKGIALYEQHRALIVALDGDHTPEHDAIAARLKFDCPLLGADGACEAYPGRELYARLFGSTFNEDGGVYGCHIVGAHLGGKSVTLLRARPVAKMLEELPLTFKRQVYPYYIHWMYGAKA